MWIHDFTWRKCYIKTYIFASDCCSHKCSPSIIQRARSSEGRKIKLYFPLAGSEQRTSAVNSEKGAVKTCHSVGQRPKMQFKIRATIKIY